MASWCPTKTAENADQPQNARAQVRAQEQDHDLQGIPRELLTTARVRLDEERGRSLHGLGSQGQTRGWKGAQATQRDINLPQPSYGQEQRTQCRASKAMHQRERFDGTRMSKEAQRESQSAVKNRAEQRTIFGMNPPFETPQKSKRAAGRRRRQRKGDCRSQRGLLQRLPVEVLNDSRGTYESRCKKHASLASL